MQIIPLIIKVKYEMVSYNTLLKTELTNYVLQTK